MKILSTRKLLKKLLVIELIAIICLTNISNGKMRSFEFVEDIQNIPAYEVLEGDTIDLICSRELTKESEKVSILGGGNYYVENGELIQSMQGNINFTKNETVVILSIYDIKRNNVTDFICLQVGRSMKYLNLRLLYRPKGYPLVISNYTPQHICDDESRGPFQFNCTTEVGDPPVNTSLYIEKEGKNLSVNSVDYNITLRDGFMYLSFVTYVNSSFNDARLVCSINQQLPAPYENYKKSEFIDFSPRASLHIHPPNYTITKEREVITVTCASNVSEFLLEWNKIPLEDTQYDISRADGWITLIIFDYGSLVDGSIIVECKGSCGERVISKEVTISLNNGTLEGKDGKDVKMESAVMFWILGFLCLMVIIILFIIFIVVLTYKRKCDNTSKADGNQSHNNRDVYNLPSERRHLGYSDQESRGNQNREEMINEPIDEKEKIGREDQNLTASDNVSQNNSSMEMVLNPEYQPFKSKIESEINGTDDDYATVC